MQRSHLRVGKAADQANEGNQPRQPPGHVSPAGWELSGHATTP